GWRRPGRPRSAPACPARRGKARSRAGAPMNAATGWFTPERLRVYGIAWAIMAFAIFVDTALTLAGRDGPPGDADFLSFRAAAELAWQGRPEAAWDRAAHAAAQTALQGAPGRYYAFFYPPTFLLICLPLAALPLLPAFVAFAAATGAALFALLRAWLPGAGWVGAMLMIAAPVTVLNALHGQNGFLTAALLAVAGLAMDRRPAIAGAALASLAFKPQLGLLVIPALLAARRWAALAWAAVAGVGWVVATLLAFGPGVWFAFLDRLPGAGDAVAQGVLEPWQLQSVFGLLRGLGIGPSVAGVVQGAVTLGAIGAVAWMLRRRPGGRAEMAAVAAGAPITTPFVFVYDLTLLLLPMAWILAEARRDGFLPGEKAGLVAAYFIPAASIVAGLSVAIGFGALAPAIMLALVLRRIGRTRGD
ncbi:glycosyltransferase family 87 protein, partial [Neoroseomonas rubea]|uniref:glycosyltransferase family 87 protein n=1 Tax=Neoroseomonas rubea TaxID=2748666 RepID=UPI001E656824